MTEEKDYYCPGSCMPYCADCKWRARWEIVGELPRVERDEKWPGLVRLSDSACQITSGKNFKAIRETA